MICANDACQNDVDLHWVQRVAKMDDTPSPRYCSAECLIAHEKILADPLNEIGVPFTRNGKAAKYSIGYEQANARGQVFVFLPDHHLSRGDGFVARSKVVVEAKLGRQLDKEERVLHYPNMDPGDDNPENLIVFPNQRALQRFRSEEYHREKDQDRRDQLQGLTEKAKEMKVDNDRRMEERKKKMKAAQQARRKKEKA